MLGKGAAGERYSGIYFAGSGSRDFTAGRHAGLCVGHCRKRLPQGEMLPLGFSDWELLREERSPQGELRCAGKAACLCSILHGSRAMERKCLCSGQGLSRLLSSVAGLAQRGC